MQQQEAQQACSTGKQGQPRQQPERQLGQPTERQQSTAQQGQQPEEQQAQQPGQPSAQQQAHSAPTSLQSGQAALLPMPSAQLKQEQPAQVQAAEQGLEDMLLDAADAPAAAAAGLTYELAAAFLVLPAEQVQAKASTNKQGRF